MTGDDMDRDKVWQDREHSTWRYSLVNWGMTRNTINVRAAPPLQPTAGAISQAAL